MQEVPALALVVRINVYRLRRRPARRRAESENVLAAGTDGGRPRLQALNEHCTERGINTVLSLIKTCH